MNNGDAKTAFLGCMNRVPANKARYADAEFTQPRTSRFGHLGEERSRNQVFRKGTTSFFSKTTTRVSGPDSQTDRQSRTLHRTEGRTAPVHSVGHKMTGDGEVVETTAHEKSGVKITPLQKSKKKNSGEYRDLWCESCRWRGPRRYRNPCILQAQLAGDQVLVDILKR